MFFYNFNTIENGARIADAELYTTASPCWNCFKLLANAGIKTVYFGEFYRDRRSIDVARRLGIELVDLNRAEPDSARPRQES